MILIKIDLVSFEHVRYHNAQEFKAKC